MNDQESNSSTRDLSSAHPRLRGDLRIHFQDCGYVLEDPVAGNFFHLGAVEYRFMQLLDGSVSVADAIGQLSVEAEQDALSEESIIALLRALADSNLLQGASCEQAEKVRDEARRRDDGQHLIKKGSSLLFYRMPLGNPDRFLDRITPFFSWLFSPAFFFFWCAIVVTGIFSVGQNWTRFCEESGGVFEAGNLFFLAIIWVILKIVHESWHALACKHFGGSVPEAGMVLLLFVTPLGYVNATSATKFQSKWKRMFVSAAGIYGELFAAGLAAIAWSYTEPGIFSRALLEVIILSSVTTILFNANPLMRFDGYYIFADLTGVPNLFAKAQRSAAFWFRRWALGANAERCPLPERDRSTWITAYGIGTYVWRAVIVVGILSFVIHRWNGAGLMAGLITVAAMLAVFVRASINYFRKHAYYEQVSPANSLLRLFAAMIVLGICLISIQIKPAIRVAAAVDWKIDGDVRVECPGFVVQRYVDNGALVKEGQPLARIRNLDEEARLRQLRIELQRLEISAAQYRQEEDIAALQATLRQIEALGVRLLGLEKYVNSLEITAPYEGVVFGLDWENLDGRYVEKGQVLCTVGQADSKQLVLAVAQDRSEAIGLTPGTQAHFHARGRIRPIPATMARINPHASKSIPHFGLIAPANGPLVARRNPGIDKSDQEMTADDRIHADLLTRQFELAKPHFQAIAELDKLSSVQLQTGEIGYVKIRGERRSLWELITDAVSRSYREAGTEGA